MRNGELKCMCRSLDMRCSLQGAIEQQNNWVAGARPRTEKPSALTDDAARLPTTVLWVRYAIPAASCSAQQALGVRRQQHREEQRDYSLVSKLPRLLPLL